MAKPNLALIPATIGDKVYSILPSDGVGDFDFDRASTATRINAQGLIETVASGENRLNYSLLDGEVVGCPHLLLEPARTNILTYSEDFSQWSNTRTTITSNATISPSGLNNGTLLITENDSASNNKYIQSDLFNISSGAKISGSIFLKANQLKWTRILLVNSALNKYIDCFFDLSNGVVGTSTSVGSSTVDSTIIEDYGNGWFRCSIVGDLDTSTDCRMRVYMANGDNDSSVYGDGTSSIYLWGAMLEVGSFPTSYIKTTSAAVTRAAETCNGSGNAATFNDSEGVLMAEVSVFDNDTSNRDIYLSDGTANNRIRLRFNSSNNLDILLYNGSIQVSTTQVISHATNFNKIAFKYKANDFALWVNGIEVFTEPSGTVCSGLNDLSFWATYVSSNNFYGNTKQIQYFDSILDSEQLEQLTSWDSFRAMAEGQLYTIE